MPAFYAMYLCAKTADLQCVMMAPTEVLAQTAFLSTHSSVFTDDNINIELIVREVRTAAQTKAHDLRKRGDRAHRHRSIGTHAWFLYDQTAIFESWPW